MDKITIFSGKMGNGELVVDFSNRYIVFQTANRKLNFSDITGIELSKPGLLTGAVVAFIVRGYRYKTNDLSTLTFGVDKENFSSLESCLRRLSKELNVSIKGLYGYDVPEKIYAGEFDCKENKKDEDIKSNILLIKKKEERRVKNRNIGLIVMILSILAILIACTSTRLAALAIISVFVGFIGFLIFARNIKPPENINIKAPKQNSGTKEIVKGAVIGSIVAGDVGAVVGAVAAKNKIDNQKK